MPARYSIYSNDMLFTNVWISKLAKSVLLYNSLYSKCTSFLFFLTSLFPSLSLSPLYPTLSSFFLCSLSTPSFSLLLPSLFPPPTLSLCLSLSSLWNTYSFFLLFPTLYLLIITVECQNETHDVIIDLSSTLHLRHIIATFFFSNLLFWIIILILNCKYRIKFLIYTLQFVNVKSYFAVQSVIFTFYVSLYSYLQFGQLAAKDIVISNRFK